jgi:hypothetical protein
MIAARGYDFRSKPSYAPSKARTLPGDDASMNSIKATAILAAMLVLVATAAIGASVFAQGGKGAGKGLQGTSKNSSRQVATNLTR